jgi:hypothetical protein
VVDARIRFLTTIAGFLGVLMSFVGRAEVSPVKFARDFAPAEGWIKPVERPYRQEVCLNGLWQFQPIPVPPGWTRDRGIAPELPMPEAARWEAVPIKIPSPWNVNTWGAGRDVGAGTSDPYWPSSVYYPSYPPHWDGAEMGWLQRSFRVPETWGDRRIVLHGVPENAKCAAVILHDKVAKPNGAALVEIDGGDGSVVVSSQDVVPASKANAALWRRLFARAGVRVGVPSMKWLVAAGVDGGPGASWRYTLTRPSNDWTEPGFDDRDWRTGIGGFGNPGVLNAKRQTPWETSEIWLRTSFDGAGTKAGELKFTVYHDEDIEVYLNGILAFRRGGS